MPPKRLAAENQLITAGARIARNGAKLATVMRQKHDAERAAEAAKAAGPIIEALSDDVARAIAAAAPLLTAEQRDMLRPILAGTLPAQTYPGAAQINPCEPASEGAA